MTKATRKMMVLVAAMVVFPAAVNAAEWSFGTDATFKSKREAEKAAMEHALILADELLQNETYLAEERIVAMRRGETLYAVVKVEDASGEGWRCNRRDGSPIISRRLGEVCTMTARQFARRRILPDLQVRRLASE